MRCIIAGGREITYNEFLLRALDACPFTKEITRIVCGMAPGVDTLGYEWANRNNIQVDEFPANWNKYGKSAGIIRNTEMAKNADALIAIPGKGQGTRHMIKVARQYNLRIFVYEINS
jgi:hypothetical protein